MKLTELEQRMKADFDENEFSPKEGDWERMQQALKPKRSSVLLLLPFSKAVAAAAVLVALGTSGLYLFFSHTGKTGSVAQSAPAPVKPVAPSKSLAAHKPDAAEEATYPGFSGLDQARIKPGKTNENISPAPQDKTDNKTSNETYTALADQDQAQTTQPLKPVSPADLRNSEPSPTSTGPAYTPYQAAQANPLRLGLAAGVGKPSLGNVQYNVSVVARTQITNRLFAEANVSLSSGNINYSEKGALPPSGGNGGNGGIPSDGLNNIAEPPSLNYASNIISVGVAPSLGYKISSNLSVSGGADIYKALNRDLKYQSAGNLPPDKSYSLPIPQRSITDWDFGLKAQAEFRLNKNFSFSTQYRQGLTQYILIDGRSLKNSNFTVGFRYYLLKVK